MKTIKTIIVLVACLAIARAQCPFSDAEIAQLDFKPVPIACAQMSSNPSFDACDACAGALTSAFDPVYDKIGVTCESIPSTPGGGAQSNLAQAMTPCISAVQAPMQKAGVDVLKLMNLRTCPSDKYGPKLAAAIQARCPDWKPAAAAASTAGR